MPEKFKLAGGPGKTVTETSRLFSLAGQGAPSVIPWLLENFKSYFDVKRWLEEHDLPFTVAMEGHA